jgi:putative protease
MNNYTELLEKVSHREYCEGFLFNECSNISKKGYIREYNFAGVVKGYDVQTGMAVIEQRYKFSVGDTAEFLRHGGEDFKQVITVIVNGNGESVQSAPHPKEIVRIKTDKTLKENDLMIIKERM